MVSEPRWVQDGDDQYPDYDTCPYFRRWFRLPGFDPEGICAFGCYDEPTCVTGVDKTEAEWEALSARVDERLPERGDR